jgi:hypothetical protein
VFIKAAGLESAIAQKNARRWNGFDGNETDSKYLI